MAKPIQKKEAAPVSASPMAKRPEPTRNIIKTNEKMVFGAENFKWLFAGMALIAVGLLCMVGGGQDDVNQWNPKEIYSARITVLAPILMLAGFAVVCLSLFRKNDDTTV
jgi:hypothetical protein